MGIRLACCVLLLALAVVTGCGKSSQPDAATAADNPDRTARGFSKGGLQQRSRDHVRYADGSGAMRYASEACRRE